VLGIAMAGGLLSALAAFQWSGLVRWMANLNYDLLVECTTVGRKVDSRLEVVLVDDASVVEAQQYPLGRNYHARLASALKACGVDAVVWDFLFDLPDPYDAGFAQAMEKVPSFVAVATSPRLGNNSEQAPPTPAENDFLMRFALGEVGTPNAGRVPQNRVTTLPQPGLLKAAAGGGHVHRGVDEDGLMRRSQLVLDVRGHLVPALPLAVAMHVLGVPREDFRLSTDGRLIVGEKALPKPLQIPIDREGNTLGPVVRSRAVVADYRSFMGTLVSAEKYPDSMGRELRGKTLVVGVACTGSGDFVAMPGERDVPGCVLVFCTINAILTQQFLWPAGAAWGWILTLALPLVLAVAAIRRRPWLLLAASLTLVGFLLLATWLLFQRQVFLPVGMPLLATLLTAMALLGANHVRDWRYAKQLAEAMSRFVSPALLQQIQRGSEAIAGVEAKRVEVSTLFVDVAGFTQFCEDHEPESIAEFLAGFYRMAIQCVVQHDGTVDKVMGDGIMAYFGAPTGLEQKERSAVLAGLAALDAFSKLRKTLADRGFPDLDLRCAVTTGYVTMGCFGDRQHATFTILGRCVNLASRLQGAAPPGSMLVDKPTAVRIEDQLELQKMEVAALKGIDRKLEVWRVTGRRCQSDRGSGARKAVPAG
jgi:adenylate cyclase